MAGVAALAAVVLFVGLGVWQLERRVWKHALIARVQARVGATPVAAPPPGRWPEVDAEHDEYRHVRLAGRWLPDSTARVQAVTRLGAGCWLLTALRQDDASLVFVNRGFLGARSDEPDVDRATPASSPPSAAAAPSPCAAHRPAPRPPAGRVEVTGLLRLTEPGGGFLRRNDPTADRWFSRDVAAVAVARRLGPVAPFFVDADADATAPGSPPAAPEQPVGGLTVVDFRDDHLSYALTWFALAGIAGFAAWRLVDTPRRSGDG